MYVETEIVAEAGSKRAALVKHFTEKKAVALERIEKFREEMGTHPAKALEWADNIFEATAVKEVCDMVLYMLKHYSDISDITKSLQSSMRDKARYINNKSTSTCSNFMKECLLSQVVQALEHVELVASF
jgi:hypothetical protein